MTDPPRPTLTAFDYESLIDAPTWAFIRATEAAYAAQGAGSEISDQRRAYDAMCRAFYAGRPPDIRVEETQVAGIACRRYLGRGPVVIYLHGGGFVVGGLHSHDDICAEICATTGLTVLAVDYRLCPEHPHPAAYEDCLAVARATPGDLLLAGDSAGGALAAAVAATLRSSRVLGQVLIYPGLGGAGESHRRHARAPLLTAEDVALYARLRGAAGDDATAFPLRGSDFSGLPPTLALAAACDPLADDAVDYAARITAAGGRAVAFTETGLVHGHLRARHRVPRARESFARVTSTLAAFAAGRWPFGDRS